MELVLNIFVSEHQLNYILPLSLSVSRTYALVYLPPSKYLPGYPSLTG